ncbi:MAG: phosphotransferase enzyme family protein [Fimbriimonas sp.]
MSITTEEFNALDQEAQIARLEKLARAALKEFGVVPTEIASLVHAENTTFRVDSDQGRFCLRISRPGYQSTSNIRSEIAFLAALRGADFRVPDPWQSRLVTAAVPEVPEGRDCVLFRWMDGEFRRRDPRMSVADARLVGRTMGRLHAFAEGWTPPEGFDRQQTHRALGPRRPWPVDTPSPMVSEPDRELLLQVIAEAQALLNSLPQDSAYFGLLHADLHVGNLLFEGEDLNVIDFDDTGWGFWMHDFSAALAYETERDEYEAIRDAMFEGYAEARPLPPRARELLSPFIQLRFFGVGNWVMERADNPLLRKEGPEWIAGFCQSIRKLRGTEGN